jgi:hypothetical protein
LEFFGQHFSREERLSNEHLVRLLFSRAGFCRSHGDRTQHIAMTASTALRAAEMQIAAESACRMGAEQFFVISRITKPEAFGLPRGIPKNFLEF